jgi:hypothetical protein
MASRRAELFPLGLDQLQREVLLEVVGAVIGHVVDAEVLARRLERLLLHVLHLVEDAGAALEEEPTKMLEIRLGIGRFLRPVRARSIVRHPVRLSRRSTWEALKLIPLRLGVKRPMPPISLN